ncbi:unnamed protein product [Closterium sp. NIES-64]|nr:unnamed protein product [Closterium sp. NIES-64]
MWNATFAITFSYVTLELVRHHFELSLTPQPVHVLSPKPPSPSHPGAGAFPSALNSPPHYMASLARCSRPALRLARVASPCHSPHSLVRLLPALRAILLPRTTSPRRPSFACAHRHARPLSGSAYLSTTRGSSGQRREGDRGEGRAAQDRGRERGAWRTRAGLVGSRADDLTAEPSSAAARAGSIAVGGRGREASAGSGKGVGGGRGREAGNSEVSRGSGQRSSSERGNSSRQQATTGAASAAAVRPTSKDRSGGSSGKGEMPKRKRGYTAEEEAKRLLNQCSKHGDLRTALALFDAHVAGTGPAFKTYEFNIALYLCALVASSGQVGSVPRGGKGKEGGKEKEGENGAGAGGGDSSAAGGGEEGGEKWSKEEAKAVAGARGMDVWADMQRRGVPLNEATFTALARLASARGDAPMAFRVVRDMAEQGVPPRHRSYDPALLAFCRQGDLRGAEEVFQHMAARGLAALPEQVAALLDVSVRAGSPGSVYKNIHRMRKVARGLPEDVIGTLRAWFESERARQGGAEGEGGKRAEGAGEAGSKEAESEGEREAQGGGAEEGRKGWTQEEAERAMAVNGGGWHGLGWAMHRGDAAGAGAGETQGGSWQVQDVQVDEGGTCSGCSARLATIDLDDAETERFARAVDALVEARGKARELAAFKAWLARHGPFPAVVDAANVGLYNQNFAQGGFNFWQLHSIAKAVAALGPAGSGGGSEAGSASAAPRLPLLVVHHKRVKGGPAAEPFAQQCLAQYEQQHCLFTTPTGANDDWYWLYAAISMRCLLVSNDEMRDHIFQTLSADYFSRWKERHQVRFTMTPRGPVLRMPPNFSFVIQESSDGAWHFPKAHRAGGQGEKGDGGQEKNLVEGGGEVEMCGEGEAKERLKEGSEGEGGSGEGGGGLFDKWLCVQWKRE